MTHMCWPQPHAPMLAVLWAATALDQSVGSRKTTCQQEVRAVTRERCAINKVEQGENDASVVLKVLNLLLFRLTGRPYDEAQLAFLAVDEQLVDIGDDLCARFLPFCL